MHYYVGGAVDHATGQRYVLGLARADDAGTVEHYVVEQSSWVDAPDALRGEIKRQDGWEPVLSQTELDTAFDQLPEDRERWLNTPVQPGYWLSVPHSDGEPRALFRSTDGHSLDGYAVSSGQWELMPYPATPALNDPAVWQPVAADAVADTQASLQLLWDLKEINAVDAPAPQLVKRELTESSVRQAIVQYIIEILKMMPNGLVVGYQAPGRGGAGSTSIGPVLGQPGMWDLETSYRVWGFPKGAGSDVVFDAFKRLFDAWGWTYRYDNGATERSLVAWTGSNRKYAFHVNITRYSHGGVSMRWTSPYFPAEHADPDRARPSMPSVITKDGIQSWVPPIYSHHAGDDDVNEFDEIIRRYDFLRRAADLTRTAKLDEPDWEEGRLYFRSDYRDKLEEWPRWREQGDWGAWIIGPAPDENYSVSRSLVPERSNSRQETVEVVFSRVADAGKYIIAQLGDSIRSHLGLATLAVQWDDSGADPRIDTAPADPVTIDTLVRADPSTSRPAAEEHLEIYRLRDDPDVYAIAFPGDPYLRVLATTFAELQRELLDGMPDSITAQSAR